MGHADTFPNPALAPDPTTREHWLLRYSFHVAVQFAVHMGRACVVLMQGIS